MKKKSKTGIFVLTKLPRMLLIMKSIVILLFCTLNLQAAVYSQHQKKFDISLNNVTVSDVFRYLHEVSQYDFVYDSDAVKQMQPVSVDLQNTDIESVLNTVLAGTPFGWSIEDNVIIIRRNEQPTPSAQQQSKVLKGKVTDKQGNTLPGVTILIKGTTIGNITDANGEFNFEIPDMGNIVLVFSFVGMKPQEVAYTGQTTLKVVMEEETTEMDEVVVTGIFTRKAESFTGSVATYKGEELKKIGTQNILQSLKTLDPSFRITPNNQFGSDPNRLPDINIRGKSSISNIESEWGEDPNRPLFILDGFEVDLQTVVDLSMDRIASVSILKDAASTAMYGSRAANGVMVIETVKPKPGKVQVYYNGSLNIDMPDLSDYNMMNAEEKLAFEVAAGFYEDNITEELYDKEKLYNKRLADVRNGVDSYWLNEGLRTGLTHKHNLRITGGDEAMYYSFGLNYTGNQGVMEKSGRDVFGGNINLVYRVDKLQVTNDFTYDWTKAYNAPVAFSEYVRVNPYYKKEINPEHPKYLEVYTIGGTTYRRDNPLYNASLPHKDETQTNSFRNNFQIEYRPITGLKIAGKLNITKSDSKSEAFKSPNHTDFDDTPQIEKGSYTKSTTSSMSYNGDVSVTFGKNFNEAHMLNVVGRWEFKSQKNYSDSYQAIGFPTDRLSSPAFAISYPTTGRPSYNEALSRTMNMMLTAGYGFKERYLIDLTIRRDGSTNFGKNKLWTNTWSVGLAWNIHNENFMGDWADLLKLRFAYGNPGNNNQAFDTYLAYTYNTDYQNIFGLGAQLGSFGNKDLDWQKTRDMTIGADISVLNRRLSLTFDYYRKITDPLIISISVAPSTGKDSYITNVGRNTINGFTVDLNARVLDIPEKDLTWNVSLNGYHETSEYSKIGNRLDNFNEEMMTTSLARYRDGYSSTDIWTVQSAGIDPMTGKEIYIRKDGTYTFTYNQNDEVVCGNTAPDVEGVIGTSFWWKGLSFSAYFRYSIGGDYFNNELFQRIENIGTQSDQYNQDKRAYYDRWQYPGQHAKYRDIRDYSSGHQSSRYVQKNNFFTGESIALGYQFYGHKWLEKVGLKNLTLNATLNDIFRVSTVKAERGTSYPFARTVSISLNASF